MEELPDYIGRETGVSDWIEVGQDRIDAFADITDDHMFLHVDPERAAQSEYRGTIAHGFLTLALLAPMCRTAALTIEDIDVGVNYGFDHLRMLAPVPAGARIRGRFKLGDVEEKRPGRWVAKYDVTVEVEHRERPAIIATWLMMYFGEE